MTETLKDDKPFEELLQMAAEGDEAGILDSAIAGKARAEAIQIPKDYRKSNLIRSLEDTLVRVRDDQKPIMTISKGMREWLEENYDSKNLNNLSKEDKISAIEEYMEILKKS